jgi:hypothetical protein
VMREMLFEAALVLMTHSRKWSWLKAWGMKIARHRGMKRAIVAVARRLAVIMHRMWVDGTEFRWKQRRSCGGMTGSGAHRANIRAAAMRTHRAGDTSQARAHSQIRAEFRPWRLFAFELQRRG